MNIMQLSNNILALLFLFLFLQSTVIVESYKYLAVLHTKSRSHFIVGESLMKTLAEKGHEVYVISPYPQMYPVKNYYDIPMEISYDDDEIIFDRIDKWWYLNMFNDLSMGIQDSDKVLRDNNVQALMASNSTFDAVICEINFSESLFGLSEHFKAPLIGLSTQGATSSDTHMVGSPSPPSYVPSNRLKFSDHMSLAERVVNLFVIAVENVYINFFYLPRQAALYELYFPHAERDMYTVRKNAALVLLNTHVSFDYPRPYMPNHIEVGGMHISRERSPLPLDIENFILEAEHGVIYFSLGPDISSSDMPFDKKQEVLRALRNIKQRVIWQYENPMMAGKPKSILINDWFPQRDILDHENVKLFITHGDILAITESVYHGTPIIGIPLNREQRVNMARAVDKGFAISLDFKTITARSLLTAIKTITSNETTYTQRAKELSALYKDQPMLPKDLAVFWVEYVVRHKGAEYLHCAGLDLNFFQYHSIDIWFFVLLFLCVFLLHHRIWFCVFRRQLSME